MFFYADTFVRCSQRIISTRHALRCCSVKLLQLKSATQRCFTAALQSGSKKIIAHLCNA